MKIYFVFVEIIKANQIAIHINAANQITFNENENNFGLGYVRIIISFDIL